MSDPLPEADPEGVAAAIAEHPFCAGLDVEHVRAMAREAALVSFAAGSFALRRGEPAATFQLITDGMVALELAEAGQQPLVLETLQAGDTLGWSWLYPHQSWSFDARCVTDVRTIAFDAARLRALMDADAAFGRELGLRIGRVVVDRLFHTRTQILELQQHDG